MNEQKAELSKISDNLCTFLTLHTTTTSEIHSKMINLNRNVESGNLKIELALTRLNNFENIHLAFND